MDGLSCARTTHRARCYEDREAQRACVALLVGLRKETVGVATILWNENFDPQIFLAASSSIRPRFQCGDVSVAIAQVMGDLMDQYVANQMSNVGAGSVRVVDDWLAVEEDAIWEPRSLQNAAREKR